MILAFCFGAIIGSFLNVCIYRYIAGESIVSPPSHCPNCKKNILWYDNIPVLSYIFLRGKCRFCGGRISLVYPAVELLTAALTLSLFAAFGSGAKFFVYALFAYGLIVATFVDFKVNEIPDQVSLGGLAAGLALAALFPSVMGAETHLKGFLSSVFGAAAGGAAIYAMGFVGEIIFRKEAMGGGDVKLMAMIGSFLGLRLVLFTFFLAPLFGSMVGLVLKMRDGREIIPYGPYLSLAALVALFFGKTLLNVFFCGLI